jgi:hypothetical protein
MAFRSVLAAAVAATPVVGPSPFRRRRFDRAGMPAA